jgi:hypothetical protein
MALLYGGAGCVTAQNGGFRHGQGGAVDASAEFAALDVQVRKMPSWAKPLVDAWGQLLQAAATARGGVPSKPSWANFSLL